MWEFIGRLISQKIYLFALSIMAIIFYSIDDMGLDKLAVLRFKQEYGGFIFIVALFCWIISVLIVLRHIFNIVRTLILNYSQNKHAKEQRILLFQTLDSGCKEMLWSLLQANQQTIMPREINEKNCDLLEKRVFFQDGKYFKVKDEDWLLLQKYQNKIFFGEQFSNR